MYSYTIHYFEDGIVMTDDITAECVTLNGTNAQAFASGKATNYTDVFAVTGGQPVPGSPNLGGGPRPVGPR